MDIFGRTGMFAREGARSDMQQTTGITLTQANNTFLKLDGTNAITGNIFMGSKRIHGLGDPIASRDAATKSYVDQVRGCDLYVGSTTISDISGVMPLVRMTPFRTPIISEGNSGNINVPHGLHRVHVICSEIEKSYILILSQEQNVISSGVQPLEPILVRKENINRNNNTYDFSAIMMVLNDEVSILKVSVLRLSEEVGDVKVRVQLLVEHF